MKPQPLKTNTSETDTLTHPITELFHDIRQYPDSFPDVDYRTLLKVLGDIGNQSKNNKEFSQSPIASGNKKPRFIKDAMIMRKPGFKDPSSKLLNIIVFELIPTNDNIQRMQLAIHASKSRPAHLGIRVLYYDTTEWGMVDCSTNTVLKTFNNINK